MTLRPQILWRRYRLGAGLCVATLLGCAGGELRAQERVAARELAPGTLTSIEQIWQVPEAEKQQWHRLRLDYLVYYFDPLWQAMWGRCGEAESYLSLGPKDFPIAAGQRILVEGLIRPAEGMKVEEPKVTILAAAVPLAALSTAGQIGAAERFNKRVVTLEGYVDRQSVRDSNHLDLDVVAEGRAVLVQLLLRSDTPIPQLKGSFVRVKGVYFSRSEAGRVEPKIEVWVQGKADVEVVGSLERDERFNLPATPIAQLDQARPGEWVHVVGTLGAVAPGRLPELREGTGSVGLQTAQVVTPAAGEAIEAIGHPVAQGGEWVLQQALFRGTQSVVTTMAELWTMSEADQRKWHQLRMDFIVYYYDPTWKGLWGRSGKDEAYLPLGDPALALKSGQRILIAGAITLRNGVVMIEHPTVTVRGEEVLEPVDTRGQLGNAELLNKRYVVIEGFVDRQQPQVDRTHVEIDLVAEGRPIIGRVFLREGAVVPKWEDARVRVKGVYSATSDPMGTGSSVELWIPGVEQIEVLGTVDQDARFALPLTPLDKLEQVAPGTMVRVAGVVRSQQPGTSLTIRDETGQVTLRTAQARVAALGDTVEAIGLVVTEGTEPSLQQGMFRRSQVAAVPPAAGLPTLRLADQLRELLPEEAARSHPVQLSGIVTWARDNSDFFFIRDASGGVCVYRPPDQKFGVQLGTKVEVTGVSASGKFTPVVLASRVQAFSTIEMPEPREVTLEQALTGIEEAQWVSMSGYVRVVEQEGPWVRLVLATSAGEFNAMLAPNERWAKMVGAVVRVRGVCSAEANAKRQLTGIRVWVPWSRFVEVEEPAPVDPFAVAVRPIASLRQFNSVEALNRRVRVAGVVTHHLPGRLLHLQEGNESLLVLSRDLGSLAPGDRIEAVGFPGRESNRVVLREAVYRRVAAGPEPLPLRVTHLRPIDPDLDGRLVRVEGSILQVGSHDKGVELIAQQGATIVAASLATVGAPVPEGWGPESYVALTGVYEIVFDEYRRPHDVRLQLRTPADVQVLRRPPWWTPQRALGAMGVLVVALILGLGWAIALRRRVRRQTGVIRAQVENEKAARLEAALARASKLESLGVLAGGIAHDFNNLLTVVIGNLSLAKLDPKIEPDTIQCLTESERAAARAKELTQQLLTFAKGGEPIRRATRLPDLVRESAQFALHGAKQRCEFQIAPDLWPADVDRGQTGQVVHNIIINATQAMPAGGLIQIVLANEAVTAARPGLAVGRYVKMSFTDSGSGISPENIARIFEPYFTTKQQGSGLGLATVFSIVKKHQGHVEVTSTLGVGSAFHVWLPAATPEPTPVNAEPGAKPGKTGRILFMDDEATIRLLGTAVLKRQGYQVTAVADGAAVVSEYAAAKAAGRPFELVVLDLTVPGGMGGAEAMEQLLALDPQVRAIVSSGYSSDPVMANHRAHGFVGRVPKPYQASDLMNAVAAVLREA